MISTDRQTDKGELTGFPSIDKPWLRFYPRDADISTSGSMYEYLVQRNSNNMDSDAIMYFGKKYTFREFINLIDRLSYCFSSRGVLPGDRVVILGLNTPEIIASIYALNKIGAVCCMESVLQTNENLADIIEILHVKHMVILDAIYDKYSSVLEKGKVSNVFVTRICDSMPFPLHVVAGIKSRRKWHPGSVLLWKETTCQEQKSFQWNNMDSAIMLSTSGSTGVPKRAELSNYSITSLASQGHFIDLDLIPGKTMLSPAPPFLAYGISLTINLPLCNGMCVILVPNPSPEFVAKQFAKYKPNTFIGGHVFMNEIMKSHMDLSFLDAVEFGGEAVSVEYLKEVEAFMHSHNGKGIALCGYGMTEISGSSTTESRTARRLGSVGIPNIGNVMKVVEPETGEELKYGEEGEIYVSSPCLMNTYFENEEETSKVITTDEDGRRWIKTGDLGRIDEDGFIFIVGRIKRVSVTIDPISKTPIKLFLDYIESKVNELPYVERCAVTAINDPERNSVPIAFVLLKHPMEEAEKTICSSLNETLDAYCQPVHYHFIKKMPFLPNGKIDYKKLEELV